MVSLFGSEVAFGVFLIAISPLVYMLIKWFIDELKKARDKKRFLIVNVLRVVFLLAASFINSFYHNLWLVVLFMVLFVISVFEVDHYKPSQKEKELWTRLFK